MPLLPSSSSPRRDQGVAEREPRLFPATGRGLGIEAVRHQQVHVDERGDVLLGDGPAPQVLAAAGTVRRVVLADAESIHPRLILVGGDDAPLAVIALERYLVSPSALVDPGVDLETSGAAAVASALGLRVERADAAASALFGTLGSAPVVAPRLPGARGAVARLSSALLLLTVGAVVAFALHPALLIAVVIVATALMVGPARTVTHLRRRALAAMTTLPGDLPGTEGLRRLSPTHPDALAQRTPAALLLGPRRIIEIHHGGETWFPGPAAGGVAAAQVTPESILLSDARGRALGRLEGGWATEPDDFRRACDEIGVRVEIDPTPMAEVPGLGRLEPWRIGEGPGRRWAFDAAEEGNLSVAAVSLLSAALPFLVVAGLLCGVWQPWAAVLVLPGAVLLIGHLSSGAQLRRWRHGARPMTEAGA